MEDGGGFKADESGHGALTPTHALPTGLHTEDGALAVLPQPALPADTPLLPPAVKLSDGVESKGLSSAPALLQEGAADTLPPPSPAPSWHGVTAAPPSGTQQQMPTELLSPQQQQETQQQQQQQQQQPKRKAGKRAAPGAPAVQQPSATSAPSLWRPAPPPREPRLPREPGVEYEEVLPPGMDASSTRTLPVPLSLLSLHHLNQLLTPEVWRTALDEPERDALRALLPRGFDEGPGGDLDALLGGKEPFHFNNPLHTLWQDLVTGAAAPRARRQADAVRGLRRQLAALELREYHDSQVSTLRRMSRLWDAALPSGAGGVAERLELWRRAAAGEVEVPDSPRHAARHARHEAAELQHDPAELDSARAREDGDSDGAPPPKGPLPTAAVAASGKRGEDFFFEGPVDFSKRPTKHQQVAVTEAAAAVAPAVYNYPVAQQHGQLQHHPLLLQTVGLTQQQQQLLQQQQYQQQQQLLAAQAQVLAQAQQGVLP